MNKNTLALKEYGKFMLKNFWWVLLGLLFNALSGWTRSMGAVYLQNITDALEKNLRGGLIFMVLTGAVFQVFGYVFRWLGAVVPTYLANRFTAETRQRLIKHLRRIPFRKFEEKSTGDLYSVLRNDCKLSGQWLYSVLSRVFTNVFLFGFSVAVMAGTDWKATLVIVAVIISAAFINQKILGYVQPHFKKARVDLGNMTHSLERTFNGFETVKTYSAKEYVLAGFSEKTRDYCESQRKATDIDAVRLGWSTLIEKLCLYCPLIYLGFLGITGAMSIGQVIMFLYLSKQIIVPIEVIFRWTPFIFETLTGWGRIQELLDIPAEESLASQPKADAQAFGAGNISYSYGTDNPVFSGVDIELKKGTVTELAGGSGSGKTTLLKCLLGLYRSATAVFKVDGAPADGISQYIAYSSMEKTLFPLSVYENLTLGLHEVSREDCMAMLDRLGFGEWVRSLPEGLDTVLSEGVSGGQRQALSTARVLLGDKPVLLLDEPFSALDGEKEKLLLDELNRQREKRAVLLTSHRKMSGASWDAVINI